MVETHDHFKQRLNALGFQAPKIPRGDSVRTGRNGLITVGPKRRLRALPLRGLMLVALGFIAFKAFMLASVGPVTYNERLATLENGTIVEQYGARLMVIDPVTETIAGVAGPILR